MFSFFYKFPQHVGAVFWRYNLLWHLLAAALTYVIVTSGGDWWYFTATRAPWLQSLLFPAAMVGGLLPIVLPLLLYAFGVMTNAARMLNTAFALGQAAILGSALSSCYKALTGRAHPLFRGGTPLTDNSHAFHFGFLRGGAFWGWPSSHTCVAFAMAAALIVLFPEKKAVKYPALLYALYIGIGVSTNIHWLSDCVAGAIIGAVIGTVVGRGFAERYARQEKQLAP